MTHFCCFRGPFDGKPTRWHPVARLRCATFPLALAMAERVGGWVESAKGGTAWS